MADTPFAESVGGASWLKGLLALGGLALLGSLVAGGAAGRKKRRVGKR